MKGYTLIEILITLLLIGILAATAIPIFQIPTLKTRQTIVKANLLELATALEQHHSLNESYENFTIPIHLTTVKGYKLSIKANKENFLLAAIPIAAQSEDPCGIFSLDQEGNKTISGKGDVNECW